MVVATSPAHIVTNQRFQRLNSNLDADKRPIRVVTWLRTKAHHDVEGVDAGDVHGRKQDHEVRQHAAGSGKQRRRRPVRLGGVVRPVNVAAAVHLESQNQNQN